MADEIDYTKMHPRVKAFDEAFACAARQYREFVLREVINFLRKVSEHYPENSFNVTAASRMAILSYPPEIPWEDSFEVEWVQLKNLLDHGNNIWSGVVVPNMCVTMLNGKILRKDILI